MISLVVKSLYTSVPNVAEIKAGKKSCDKHHVTTKSSKVFSSYFKELCVQLQTLSLNKKLCHGYDIRYAHHNTQIFSCREGKLITDLYVKQTDSHQYLDPSSCHPYHCTESVPYSQAFRINRICSENVSFNRGCNVLEELLIKGNCNPALVMNKFLKPGLFLEILC